jgi:hypothetical protein
VFLSFLPVQSWSSMTDISDLSEMKPRITVFGVGGDLATRPFLTQHDSAAIIQPYDMECRYLCRSRRLRC